MAVRSAGKFMPNSRSVCVLPVCRAVGITLSSLVLTGIPVQRLVHPQVADIGQQASAAYDRAVLAGKEDLALGFLTVTFLAANLGDASPLKAGIYHGRGLPGQARPIRKHVGEVPFVRIIGVGSHRHATGIVSTLAGVVTDHIPDPGIIRLWCRLPLRPGLGNKRVGSGQVGHGFFLHHLIPEVVQQPGRSRLVFYIRQQGGGQVRQLVPRRRGATLQRDAGVRMARGTGSLDGLWNVLFYGVVPPLKGIAKRLDL